ncbi:MAG TPA: hypothetical protein VN256_04895 [Pyrinomonadaceae bacterium]|nr:hypothetical protein [Pyrinomonadaceae bacterium]
MALLWITCGAALAALAWYVLWRRPIRCYLCSKRIRGPERSAHYPINGRRRVVCGRCDDNNLRLTSAEPQGR